jgi:hypothetical protein
VLPPQTPLIKGGLYLLPFIRGGLRWGNGTTQPNSYFGTV